MNINKAGVMKLFPLFSSIRVHSYTLVFIRSVRINLFDLYNALNIFFFAFHTCWTLFNIVGWMFRATRRWHLVTMLLTAGSWFILGIWYGWGYCLCTDWHWQVRRELGFRDESNSYIHFLVLKLTGINFPAPLVEHVTLIVFVISFIMTIWLNVRDQRNKRARYT